MRGPKLLKAWRERAGLTQAAAGKLLGVHQSTWALWEQEDHGKSPRVDRAIAIAKLTRNYVPVAAWAKQAA